jgi:hypothetical protein
MEKNILSCSDSSFLMLEQELLGMEMAEFKINMEYCWSDGKGLTDLTADKKKKSRKTAAVPATPVRRSTRVRERQHDTVDEQEEQAEAEMELN